MLDLTLAVLIGAAFLGLANKYDKRRRILYVVAGIVAYLAGAFMTGVFISFLSVFKVIGPSEEISDIVLDLLSVSIAVLCCSGLYWILKKRWSGEFEKSKASNVLDNNF